LASLSSTPTTCASLTTRLDGAATRGRGTNALQTDQFALINAAIAQFLFEILLHLCRIACVQVDKTRSWFDRIRREERKKNEYTYDQHQFLFFHSMICVV
jgi:hypothetical protein